MAIENLRLASLATPTVYLEDFGGFLQNPPFEKYAREIQTAPGYDTSNKPCLLDLIQLWLASGEAAAVCLTYESFLLAVIMIIDWWTSHGEQKQILDGYLWPDFANGADGKRPLPIEVLWTDTSDSTVNRFISDHPALRRENYDSVRAWRERARSYQMEEKLDELLRAVSHTA